mmetsp:Transcript_102697/g.229355  ORF Transcript_102697/g.229355 Transcript_102697/m.229355 type:complete len:304 (-) Transcript_102697:358-1269(-)
MSCAPSLPPGRPRRTPRRPIGARQRRVRRAPPLQEPPPKASDHWPRQRRRPVAPRRPAAAPHSRLAMEEALAPLRSWRRGQWSPPVAPPLHELPPKPSDPGPRQRRQPHARIARGAPQCRWSAPHSCLAVEEEALDPLRSWRRPRRLEVLRWCGAAGPAPTNSAPAESEEELRGRRSRPGRKELPWLEVAPRSRMQDSAAITRPWRMWSVAAEPRSDEQRETAAPHRRYYLAARCAAPRGRPLPSAVPPLVERLGHQRGGALALCFAAQGSACGPPGAPPGALAPSSVYATPVGRRAAKWCWQ